MTVGVINHAPAADAAFTGFRAGMAELGYIEGARIRYVYDGATNDLASLDDAAAKLLNANPDLLLSLSTPATHAALRAATRRGIPVLFAPTSNPEASGIVESLRRPGGLATGIAFGPQEARRLEWLVRLAPDIRRILVPYNSRDPSPALAVAGLGEPARKLEVELILRPVETAEEMAALAARLPDGVDAVFIPADALAASQIGKFAATAQAQRLPLSAPMRAGVEQGALVSYGFDLEQAGRQAARLADQILSGIAPAELPVELPEFRLSINIATADNIGLSIPDDILRQARLFGQRND